MGYVVWKYYKDVKVEYSFFNRSKNSNLTNYLDLDQLREEIKNVCSLKFTESEIQYLRKQKLFDENYLSYLKFLKLPAVSVRFLNKKFSLHYKGSWSAAIFWETILLCIINELYFQKFIEKNNLKNREILQMGKKKLQDTINFLIKNPSIKFIEFGTRRRFSKAWQEYVIKRLTKAVPGQILGSSNVYIARQLGIPASGTMAHQLFMVTAALHNKKGTIHTLITSQNKVLDLWEKEYKGKRNNKLLIAPTDTFGTDFFLNHFGKKQAKLWYGLRQDSGNAIQSCGKILQFYKKNKIDPSQHILIPSDALDMTKILELSNKFSKQIPLVFGWGSYLTNNLGLEQISIVIKPIKANGSPTVKLSDSPIKETGNDKTVLFYKNLIK